MDCGREVAYPRHGLCSACYGSMRLWLRAKTHTERLERMIRLNLYTRRLDNVERGVLVIRDPTIRKTKRHR